MNEYYEMQIVFLKIGTDNKVLRGQKYELVPYDTDQSTGIILEEGEYGQYYLNMEGSGSFASSILPGYIKDELNHIQTLDDFRALAQRLGDNFHFSESSYSTLHNMPLLSGHFYVPLKLKHIQGSPGYKTQDLALLLYVDYRISYDSNTNEILYKDFSVAALNQIYVDLDEYANVNTFEDLVSLTYQKVNNEGACINTNQDQIIIDDSSQCTVFAHQGSSTYTLVPFFMDEEGTVNLEISNTVNNLTKYNASSDRNLEYKIYVKNIGDVSSGDNTIVTNVPDLVVVEESSISNSGIYNQTEHTITWEVDRIDVDEQVVLSYKAIAPESANGGELIGNSTVVSAQQTTKSYSNNTIVTLDKIVEVIKNPNTGMSMIYIPNTNIGMPISLLCFVLLLIIITAIVMKKKFKLKKHN